MVGSHSSCVLEFAKRGSGRELSIVAYIGRVVYCEGMSSSSHGSNSGESDASYGELRLEFLSSSFCELRWSEKCVRICLVSMPSPYGRSGTGMVG